MGTHEQCVGATDEWYTPAHVFEAMQLCFDLDPAAGPRGLNLTVGQRNTFFDNSISRQLGRAANVDLPAQLALYDKVIVELKARLAKFRTDP